MEADVQQIKRVKIRKISVIENEDVYDITTTSNHNFLANNMLVHNCGEQTLSPGNICCLGTLNLTQFVNSTLTGFDLERLGKYAKIMVRFLDNVNSYSIAPLKEYVESMKKKRRIGIGVMGWGSVLYMLKVRFGSEKASKLREEMMQHVARSVYEASIDLAEEKGMFEFCNPEKHAQTPFVHGLSLSPEYMNKLRTHGIRNASLMSQQPNGTTAIYANVVSGGIEPVFMPEYVRTVIVPIVPEEISELTPKWNEGEWKETSLFKFAKEGDEEILRGIHNGVTYKIDKNRGLTKEVVCEDYGVRFLKRQGEWDSNADWAVSTTQLSVRDHVEDLKGFARWTDSACSKCVSAEETMVMIDGTIYYLDELAHGKEDSFTPYSGDVVDHHGSSANVKSVYNNGVKETLKITFDDGSTLRCTPTHQIYTSDGFVKAHDLKIGSMINNFAYRNYLEQAKYGNPIERSDKMD